MIEVWYLTLIVFILSIWLMASLLRFEDSDNVIERYSNSFIIIIGAMCQQGTKLLQLILIHDNLLYIF